LSGANLSVRPEMLNRVWNVSDDHIEG